MKIILGHEEIQRLVMTGLHSSSFFESVGDSGALDDPKRKMDIATKLRYDPEKGISLEITVASEAPPIQDP